jgi:glyoxylase-like metal-dependent hydrolase (beta-lactamase superfamily II)
MRPVLETFTVPPFQENTYLLGDADAGEGIVVDPGGRVDDILRVAAQRSLAIRAIVNTHSHVDHVLGVAELKARTGAHFWIHPEAVRMLQALPNQAALYGLPPAEVPEVDGALQDGQELAVGDIRLTVRDAPGHAPGHVILVGPVLELENETAPRAIVGDVIFYGSIGRTDLPGGNFETLMASIERAVLSLPDETVLYSGHGPATTVGHERAFNPFVREWLVERGVAR